MVVFHEKLVQDSPPFKSKPKELHSVIKIGSMCCPIVDSFPSVIGSSQPSQNDWAGLSPIPSCLKHHSDSTPKGFLVVIMSTWIFQLRGSFKISKEIFSLTPRL